MLSRSQLREDQGCSYKEPCALKLAPAQLAAKLDVFLGCFQLALVLVQSLLVVALDCLGDFLEQTEAGARWCSNDAMQLFLFDLIQ